MVNGSGVGGGGPEFAGGQVGAFGHGGELGPGDFGVDGHERGEGGEAAVGAGDHVLPADEAGVADQALGDQFRVLDVVGGGVEHAGDEDLAVGQGDVLEDLPLVLVPGVGALEGDRGRARGQHQVDDVGQRDVGVVRALVVAPAQVHAQPVRRDVAGGVVDGLQALGHHAAELL